MWFEIQNHHGNWIPNFSVVAAEDLPNSNYNWQNLSLEHLEVDRQGVEHALLHMFTTPFWGKITASIEYLEKDEHGWSSPIHVGTLEYHNECCSELAVTDSGNAFAVWRNEGGKLVGRWIRNAH